MAPIQKKKKKPLKNGIIWLEKLYQHMGESNDQECGRQCWILHKITKPTEWRGGAEILRKEEENARLLDRL